MGLTGCYAVLQFLVFFMNLIFWVAGLIILVLSVWMLIDPTFYISMAQDESSYYSGICLLLLVGALLFIVGFLGCFGAYSESQRLLVLFFCGLLLILVSQISAGIWAYSNSDKLQDLLRYTVTRSVHDEYGKVESRTATFDAIQEGLKCCGIHSPFDWAGSSWQNDSSRSIKYTMSALKTFRIPESCCNKTYTSEECDVALNIDVDSPVNEAILYEGCLDKLLEKLKENMITVIIFTVCIGIVETLGLVISLVLCCAVRSGNKYK